MSADWDVDSYKTEFENEDHWELKRKFMVTHKDKFPEDELVCLAQVFTNIEFMGCRYPDKTMIRVAELAKGVVEKYREKRKNSLKRTFVAASDAASSKVKGQTSKDVTSPPNKTKKMNFVQSEDQNETKLNNNQPSIDNTLRTGNLPNTRPQKYGGVKTFNINPNQQFHTPANHLSGPLSDIVLFLDNETHPVSLIQHTAAINKCAIRWEFDDGVGGLKVCKLYLNNQLIASVVGENMKISKENASTAAISKLRETNYGIMVKSKFFSDTTVSTSHLGSSSNDDPFSKVGEDNVGRKLMKLMGWQGGGLGSKQQGIEEPIKASLQVRRDGLGQSKALSNLKAFKDKARDYILTWMKSNSDQDLVFSSDFTSDERKVMHEIASELSLKSKSYGKDANRQLVISRKLGPWEIVQELRESGGSSDKYELLYPTKSSRF